MHARTHSHSHTHKDTHAHTDKHKHTYIHIKTRTHTQTSTHTSTHTHKHKHKQTRTHAHRQARTHGSLTHIICWIKSLLVYRNKEREVNISSRHTSWISQTNVSAMFDKHKILLFDYRINKPFTRSRCFISVSCSVHVISTYYMRKVSWDLFILITHKSTRYEHLITCSVLSQDNGVNG